MAKTQQKELLLQADIIGYPERHQKGPLGLRGQGFYCEKQSERFKAGRPDVRVGRNDQGQLDFELKYLTADLQAGVATGLTKLQWLHLKEMNSHGIPAVALIYAEQRPGIFFVTLEQVLCDPFISTRYVCSKLPAPQIIDGAQLFEAARNLLRDAGYTHRF